MNMNLQLLPLLLLPYWVVAADVAFLTDPAQAQARAQREEKLYFVHFTATWCIPCEWMEANTYANDTLADFANEHYLAVKLDFDDPNALLYKQRFQVTTLPSILIFDATGKLIDRYKTSLSTDELLRILQQHPAALKITPATKVAYAPPSRITRPALLPEEDTKASTKPRSEPLVPSVTAAKTSADIPPVETPARFAVQVGVYSDLTNAERACSRMEQHFQQPVAIVEICQPNKKLYKVMVGKFEQEADARDFLQVLKKQAFEGFVKPFENQ
jgi:thiol-disulfide isomerase/thioredoxin